MTAWLALANSTTCAGELVAVAIPIGATGATVQWVAGIVWAGFGVLTVCLIILMNSKWGRDKPLAKCVALSLLAHLWLALSAYGTRLVIGQPVAQPEPVFHLRTIDLEAVAPDPHPTKETTSPWKPWELAAEPVAPAQETDLPIPDTPAPTSSPANDLQVAAAVTESPAAPWRAEIDEKREPMAALPQSPSPSDDPRVADSVAPAAQLEDMDHPADPSATSSDTEVSGFLADVEAPAPQVVASSQPVARRIEEILEPTETPEAPLEMVDLGEFLPASPAESPAAPPRRWRWEEVREHLAERPPLVRPGDGRAVPELYRLRLDAERDRWFVRLGGSAQSLRAIHRALRWLADHQSTDGRWDADAWEAGQERRVAGHDRQGAGAQADTAMTGLALLAFLGAGQTQYQGEYTQVVQRGLNYLRRQQREDGCLSGRSRLFAAMYCHAIASLALSEAYALTGDPQLREAVTRALGYSLRAQHVHGGWRYQPGDPGDMSQFGWQVMAITSARYAGLAVSERERDRMRDFLQRCSVGRHRELASYRPGGQATPTMSAEAMVCRVFLEQVPPEEGMKEFQRYLTEHLPTEASLTNLYYWYYGTLALHQLQGQAWETWSRRMQKSLVDRQVDTGEHAGSWNPDTLWGSYGGRVYATSMATLSLEIYYRYLPIYTWQRTGG